MSSSAFEIYMLMVQDAIPFAFTFALCNLIVGWIFNAIFGRGNRNGTF